MKTEKTVIPPTNSHFTLNLIAGAAFFCVVFCFTGRGFDILNLILCGLAFSSVILILGEIYILKSPWRPRVGLIPRGSFNPSRIGIKLLAFFVTLAGCVLFYSLLPPDLAQPYHRFVNVFLQAMPFIVAGGAVYIALMDSRFENPHDGLWHFGVFLLGRWKQCDSQSLRIYIQSVFLRAFFIPLMFEFLLSLLTSVISDPETLIAKDAGQVMQSGSAGLLICLLRAYFFFLVVDVLFATLGYALAFRSLDTDIRSVEPTLLGWVVCMICYAPIFDMVMAPYVFSALFENPQWYEWLSGHSAALAVWGAAAIIAMGLEAMTTVNFGMRFSNLTYRGIVTGGLFRFTRHPQYVCKMVNRFLVYMPFLSLHGVAGITVSMISFLAMCIIYFLRARTEENHLSRYPEYVAYANYIEENGIFRWAGRVLPFLRFSEQRAQAHRIF